MTRRLITAFLFWLPLGCAITGLSAFVYLSFQQTGRQMANDPQIEMAEDAAVMLAKGSAPAEVVPPGIPIDMATSIAPWVAVYDAEGTPLRSSAALDAASPQPPLGLFDPATWIDPKTYDTPAGPETRVTWQPREGIRQALVLVQAANGQFVVSGRSLRDTEDRVGIFGINALIVWFVTIAASLFLALATAWIDFRLKKSTIT